MPDFSFWKTILSVDFCNVLIINNLNFILDNSMCYILRIDF